MDYGKTGTPDETPLQWVDLHTHSRASDGSDAPGELLRKADELELSAAALTDHDTVSGLEEFLNAAEGKRIRAVPGVELSTRLYTKEIHIVGLFIDPEDKALKEVLCGIRKTREARNLSMIRKLQSAGYEITYDELLSEAGGESVGRPHFARALIRKGYFQTPQDVFNKCLKRGTATYTPRELLPPAQCINAIHSAGGIAIWAHPIYRQAGERAFLKKFLRKLQQFGLDGVEAYYAMFSPDQQRLVKEMADQYGLLVSGGSDYHGENQPGIELGRRGGAFFVPGEVLKKMDQFRSGAQA